jgi:hypothetical protein
MTPDIITAAQQQRGSSGQPLEPIWSLESKKFESSIIVEVRVGRSAFFLMWVSFYLGANLSFEL